MLREYLNSIADKLREKLGTSDKINAQIFPDKIDEVYDAGYAKGKEENSGGGAELARSIVDGTITEYVDEEITKIRDYVFYYCSGLTSVDIPLVTSIGKDVFYYCSGLTSINIPLVTSIGTYAFNGCSSLTSIDLPLVTSISNYAFSGCSKLTSVNIPLVTSISSNVFRSCSNLITLILRKSDAICTLSNTNAFTSTPIASGTGYIYVPSALIETYKAATNWSTYADQFRALEDYTVDGTITGELDPDKI